MRLSSARLAVLYVALFIAGTCILMACVYVFTVRVLDSEVDTVIDAEIRVLKNSYEDGGLLRLIEALDVQHDSWGRTGAVHLLTDVFGTRIAGNIESWPTQGEVSDKWIEFNIEAREPGGPVIHPVRARVFVLFGGYRLLVGTDILERQRFFESLRNAMLAGLGLSILLAVLIGFGYRRRVRLRVIGIVNTCKAIMAGRLSERLAVEGSRDEFDSLAGAVNRMLDRIENQTQVLRTTFDSAAHDLRAPLYRARVRIEETLQHADLAAEPRSTMEATLSELDRVQRTLGTLLQIAQAEGQSFESANDAIDIAGLAREIADLYRPEAMARGIALDCEAPAQAVTIRGNRQLFAQAIVNLVENSLKYVPSGGRIVIRVATTNNAAVLEVADNGPGIPEHERERVLQPFARLERDRGQFGSGLGLSLVAAVMRLHRAEFELKDNAPGLLVCCRIPLSSA